MHRNHVLALQNSVSLSLSLLSSMSSLSYYLSLQPKRQKPFLPQNIWCIKHPPNSSFHEIYIVIAACFSSMLYFLPLPPNQTLSLSLSLFFHLHEPVEVEHSFTPKLGCRRFLESSKKSRRAASITEQLLLPISPPDILSLSFMSMAWQLLGNRSVSSSSQHSFQFFLNLASLIPTAPSPPPNITI